MYFGTLSADYTYSSLVFAWQDTIMMLTWKYTIFISYIWLASILFLPYISVLPSLYLTFHFLSSLLKPLFLCVCVCVAYVSILKWYTLIPFKLYTLCSLHFFSLCYVLLFVVSLATIISAATLSIHTDIVSHLYCFITVSFSFPGGFVWIQVTLLPGFVFDLAVAFLPF